MLPTLSTGETEGYVTLKDYAKLAAALSCVKPDTHYLARDQWESDVNAVADVLGSDNPRFDRGWFYTAAGLKKPRE